MRLFTLGYEGRTLSEVAQVLSENGVHRLIDVRERAFSFKKGFSKTPLRQGVSSLGIEYVHAPAVGSPSVARKRLHETGDYETFFAEYKRHLSGLNGRLSEVADLAYSENSCLLCFERDFEKCHRSALAEEIKRLGGNALEIVHL